MVNQSSNPGSKYVLDKLIAVCLVVWLLFFGGFSTLKALLTPARLSQAGQIADTIRTGAGRVIAPAAQQSLGAPSTAPRMPSGVPAAGPPADNAAIQQQADAAYQATAQAAERGAGNVASAPRAPAGTLPTAVIAVPTVAPIAQITVVPVAYPQTYAQSAPIGPTPIPTLVYPTPLPAAAAAYTVSPDGLCVTAPRAGKQYQVCQPWKYKPDEAASAADYIRTGLVPGVEVQ